MSEWLNAEVVSTAPAADGLFHLTLRVPENVAASHTVAGQYVKLQVSGVGEGFFAIASRPGAHANAFELLLKRGAAVADAIGALNAGNSVLTTSAQGKGFPIDKAVGHDVVLVATGSGISPIRSALETIVGRRSEFGTVSLYFGARTPQSFAYREQFDAWRAAKIEVFPVVSRPADTGWTGLTGYVQTHLGGVHIASAVAFLCGQKAMVEGVKEALAALKMPAENVYLNF
ncbi:MAG: NAD-binding oxidoreductase [Polyangiaceae bacterium]|nr:NAD-binding oxidoreductase [Polyangiaceae bacterium]